MKENIIKDKSFDFALSIIKLYQELVANKEYVLSKQLLRSATSIGANVEEAGAAISRKDFIAKTSIASKESKRDKILVITIGKKPVSKVGFH
jgi:four helix bundle protein